MNGEIRRNKGETLYELVLKSYLVKTVGSNSPLIKGILKYTDRPNLLYILIYI